MGIEMKNETIRNQQDIVRLDSGNGRERRNPPNYEQIDSFKI